LGPTRIEPEKDIYIPPVKYFSKGPVLLLVAAFFLGGAKTPICFGLWSAIALSLTAIALWDKQPTRSQAAYFGIFIGGVLLSQIYSLDSTNSQFWTTQMLIYSCLWLVLPELSSQTSPNEFWAVLTCLGGATVLITTYQWVRAQPIYGMLPLNPDFNAVWMAALLAALMAKPRTSPLEFLLILWLAVLISLGLSRSGLLALVAGSYYSACHRYPRKNILLSLGIVALICILIPQHWWVPRLNIAENGGRLRTWGIALRGLADYPLTGYGPGNFELAYHRYAFRYIDAVRYSRSTAFVHNDYLQIANEFGWPVVGLLCIGLYRILSKPISSLQPLAVPAKSILISLGVAACFNPIFKMPIFAYLALFSSSYLMNQWPSSPTVPGARTAITKAGLFLFLGFLSLSSAWCGVRSYWASHQAWDRIVSWNSADGEAWHEFAYQITDQKLAVFYHQRAVQESPNQPFYVEALARALESGSDPKVLPQTLEMYLRAINLAPKRAINYLAVTRILWRAREYGNALQWAAKASALEPYYWECDLWRARCMEKLGHANQAVFILKNLIQRREAVLKLYPGPVQSPYEQAILNFDPAVIENELRRIHLANPNAVE